jgi:hypothetical protein
MGVNDTAAVRVQQIRERIGETRAQIGKIDRAMSRCATVVVAGGAAADSAERQYTDLQGERAAAEGLQQLLERALAEAERAHAAELEREAVEQRRAAVGRAEVAAVERREHLAKFDAALKAAGEAWAAAMQADGVVQAEVHDAVDGADGMRAQDFGAVRYALDRRQIPALAISAHLPDLHGLVLSPATTDAKQALGRHLEHLDRKLAGLRGRLEANR